MSQCLTWTPEMRSTLIRLREKGAPLYECAEAIGVGYATAVYEARRLGLAARINRGRHTGRLTKALDKLETPRCGVAVVLPPAKWRAHKMATLRFDPDGVRKIVDHMTAAQDWGRGFGDTDTPRPQVIFVKDDGIYLMSNGKPPLPGSPGGPKNFVVYAAGYDPTKNPHVWDEARHAVGGDDFAEFLDLTEQQIALIKGPEFHRFALKVSPKAIEIIITGMKPPTKRPNP